MYAYMHALVCQTPGRISQERVPIPAFSSGEVLLRVEAVGICGADLMTYTGKSSIRVPVLGHELTGVVEKVATEVEYPAVGTRVTVNPLLPCRWCHQCRLGQEHLCLGRSLIGGQRQGAFAEFVAVPATACFPTTDLPATRSALAEPLACAVQAVDNAQVALGDTVIVLGAGAIGLLTAVAARQAGARRVVITDISAERRDTASQWSADIVLDPQADGISRKILDATEGLGADAVFDCVGTAMTRKQAIDWVRPGGRALMMGQYEAESPVPMNQVVSNGIHVIGSFAYGHVTFQRALTFIREGLLDAAPQQWLSTRSLAAGPLSFNELIHHPGTVAKIVLLP